MSIAWKILFLLSLLLAFFSYPNLNPAGAAVCERNRPTLGVTADNGTTGSPGQTLTYTVKVTNNDVGSDCPTSRVDLSTTILNNTNNAWKADLEKTEFATIAPGVTKSTKLYVTSPTNAADGSKTITVNAKRPNGVLISYNITYNVVVPTPTDSPTPEATPTVAPEPEPEPEQTFINLRLGIDGIGTTSRIPIGGNKNPDNIFRDLTVSLFDATTNSLFSAYSDEPFTYSSASEKFEASLEIPLTSGESKILNLFVEGPRFLRAAYPGSISIKQGQTIGLTSGNFYLITGNINNNDVSENKIDIMDYNILLSCSVYSQDLSACEEDPAYQDYSDLDDDGRVDENDFTLWLKEFANQQGVVLPG